MCMQYFQSFEEQVGVVINNNATGNGYFLDSCLVHVQTKSEATWDNVRAGGMSISEAVYSWYYNSTQIKVNDCDYPCNPTCPKKISRNL